MNGEAINQVHHMKFLGITIDEHLNWKYHIDEVCLRVAKLCGLLYKVRNSIPTEAMVSVYYTLCYPHLTFCVSIWACTCPSFLYKLCMVQKKIFRNIFFIHKFESVAPVLLTTKLMTFTDIHKFFTLLLIYKNVRNYLGNKTFHYVDNPRTTR